MIAHLTIITALVSSLALGGCDKPKQSRQPQSYSFTDEDACEDAGMSDAFCDAMFPELEDFIGKSKKPKTKVASPPVVKPVYRPTSPPKPSKSYASTSKPSSASRSATTTRR